jgi:hypothetical protein
VKWATRISHLFSIKNNELALEDNGIGKGFLTFGHLHRFIDIE